MEWRRADLYSLRDIEAGLAGVDVAIYLVHSMQPKARLNQGTFSDLDLLLADNFARGARAAGVRHVLYVGGFVPEGGALSPHLASRLEVEEALRAGGPPLTALRTGIIVGGGSSSLWILINLVRRLPLMVLPAWTSSRTQPIAVADVVRAVRTCLSDPPRWVGSFDVGGPDVLTYRSMMQRAAHILGLRRWMVGVRAFSPRFSRLWVCVFGSAPFALVGPLIESLRHDMVARANPLLERLLPEAKPFDEALTAALDAGRRPSRPPSSLRLSAGQRRAVKDASSVRSVQRLPLPPGRDARWVALEYLRWLPRFARPWIRVTYEAPDRCRFELALLRTLLLELRLVTDRSSSDRQLFEVTGGRLARTPASSKGRLEFRETFDGASVLAAVHDFQPSLPWWLYAATQAQVHLAVMRGFARHLGAAEHAAGPSDAAAAHSA